MNIEPINKRILVKKISDETVQSSSGVYITLQKEKSIKAKVISVFKDEDSKPIVKEGQVVLLSSYMGTPCEGDDNEEYLVIKETDILAIIHEKK